jgi:hypothetical protein
LTATTSRSGPAGRPGPRAPSRRTRDARGWSVRGSSSSMYSTRARSGRRPSGSVRACPTPPAQASPGPGRIHGSSAHGASGSTSISPRPLANRAIERPWSSGARLKTTCRAVPATTAAVRAQAALAAVHARGECHARLINKTDFGTAIGEGPLRGSGPSWRDRAGAILIPPQLPTEKPDGPGISSSSSARSAAAGRAAQAAPLADGIAGPPRRRLTWPRHAAPPSPTAAGGRALEAPPTSELYPSGGNLPPRSLGLM